MRRIKILFYWLFKAKFNVSFKELIQFLTKPIVNTLAKRFIKSINSSDDFYEISFYLTSHILYFPKLFPIEGVYQVSVETFDTQDWHYYQKSPTQILEGERLLDIGTAEGLFPLTVIDKCAIIIMIEPNQAFEQSLQKTFAPFNSKVKIIHSAVGNEDSIINFEGSSLGGHINRQNKNGNEVSIHKIDTLISEDEVITYLKADIEGFEYEMLKGAEQTIKRNKPRIAITTYHTENNYLEIIALIKGYVPDYHFFIKGIYHEAPKPVMVHFYL